MNKEIIFTIGEAAAHTTHPKVISSNIRRQFPAADQVPEILLLTSYPPRECGIATYSQDLLRALNQKFSDSFSLKVCALESGNLHYDYPAEVKRTLNTNDPDSFSELALFINQDKHIELVLIQHEFGFYQQSGEEAFLQFLYALNKPIILVFHTVLPLPDELLGQKVRNIVAACTSIIVMTQSAALLLQEDYGVSMEKIEVIAHGTHLVPHLNKSELKEKYRFSGKKVLTTFGLLGPGKDIGTTLSALPEIIQINPDVLFLVIGKTHPGIIESEGEAYRNLLQAQVDALNLQDHVKFINRYLPLDDLLEYLQLTDIYLFTSNDPYQAVSGTFSYAMSCGCPIISTPIPHAREVLGEDTGIIIDFQNSRQLAAGVNRLMSDEALRTAFSESTLQRIVPTAWENSAIAHARLLRKIAGKSTRGKSAGEADKIVLQYHMPEINLEHLNKMTTDFGMIQFSKINQPDPETGYTLDDNARALIARCMHFELTGDETDLPYLRINLDFISYCMQAEGYFLNYVDTEKQFTPQNYATNLADSNGRAIWSLGFLLSKRAILPAALLETAENVLEKALPRTKMMHSTRAMAFALKGIYFYNQDKKTPENTQFIKMLANRLLKMYRHESEGNWQWYESYLTYGNSILPEAMLYAWLETGDLEYKEVAKASFDFLLSQTFNENGIKVISNRSWLQKGQEAAPYGEQPIDVAYTILALNLFYKVFKEAGYLQKTATAFSWFLGNNHLHQIIYNPCTGGCYDGLEETQVNLNQGAESTLSYLMARLIMEQQTG